MRAVVPIKSFENTKSRLKHLLSERERSELSRLMLHDVLDALLGAKGIAAVSVVTPDHEVSDFAAQLGADTITDQGTRDLAGAAAEAAHFLTDLGQKAMLLIPADVPLVQSQDIELAISDHPPAPSLTLVEAGEDGGTNLLIASPPEVIPFRFGKNSFEKHVAEGKKAGIPVETPKIGNLSLDIDRPEDLQVLCKNGLKGRTAAFVTKLEKEGRFVAS